MVNSPGVIENEYCGEDDVWGFAALAMRDTVIREGDRICHFRIMKQMDEVDAVAVEKMSGNSRGGFGSTGVR